MRDSLTATGGAVDDSGAPLLSWTDAPPPHSGGGDAVRGHRDDGGTSQIVNVATVAAAGGTTPTRTARIPVNGYTAYLPVQIWNK